MKHVGDITKLSGYTLPPVDCICGGSPCQDLSTAGLRKGLEGERSGLFMEQIRIVKEMRDNDRQHGRSDDICRPRYMVWENVPGAFSSNKGKDFQAVLTGIVRIAQPESPDVPLPEKGWSKAGCLMGESKSGNPFSVAWRVHDAKWWGVPQRRKRVCVVGDFNGFSAAEILFDPELRRETEESNIYKTVGHNGDECGQQISTVSESLSRDFEQGKEKGKGIIRVFKNSVGITEPVTFVTSGVQFDPNGIKNQSATLRARDYKEPQAVVYGISGFGSYKSEKIVRRLTPNEHERLQGFPDNWTRIGEWCDSKGKLHKECDTPRYKALGNSIALPFWFWLLRRISAKYERPARLGSLFDGIGGFPYCWEKCNGKGSAIWASEIEEFPIAVTKLRFPEEDEHDET